MSKYIVQNFYPMDKKENTPKIDSTDDVKVDVESETEKEEFSDADIAEITARSKNLRTLCGCLFSIIVVLAIVAMYPVYMTFSTAEKVAGVGANTISSGVKRALETVEKIVNKKPSVDVVYGAQFLCSKPENKFIVAQVDEKIDVSPEFSKYAILKASLRLTVEAHYQYYIPLRGVKFDVRKSRDDGKFHFTFYFDSLSCDTPVKYTEFTRRANPSDFSDDVNKALEDYQKTAFPAYLVARGKNPQNMMSASMQARIAVEDYVMKNILDCAGIHKDDVGKISIIFNTFDFDSFKDGVKERKGDSK